MGRFLFIWYNYN